MTTTQIRSTKSAYNETNQLFNDGLIGLRDVEVACLDSDQTLRVPAILRLFGPEDVPRMKKEIGRKQPFLDAWSVAW